MGTMQASHSDLESGLAEDGSECWRGNYTPLVIREGYGSGDLHEKTVLAYVCV